MITNDAVVFGILISIISLVFITSNSQNKICKKFYKFVPSLLLCYFVPSIFNTLGIISGELSNLYFVASTTNPGYHLFAKNLREHNKNKKVYTSWLKKQNIYR